MGEFMIKICQILFVKFWWFPPPPPPMSLLLAKSCLTDRFTYNILPFGALLGKTLLLLMEGLSLNYHLLKFKGRVTVQMIFLEDGNDRCNNINSMSKRQFWWHILVNSVRTNSFQSLLSSRDIFSKGNFSKDRTFSNEDLLLQNLRGHFGIMHFPPPKDRSKCLVIPWS